MAENENKDLSEQEKGIMDVVEGTFRGQVTELGKFLLDSDEISEEDIIGQIIAVWVALKLVNKKAAEKVLEESREQINA